MGLMLYAFRDLDTDPEHWYGQPSALPYNAFETLRHRLDTGNNPSPFTGHQLEFRYGELPDDGRNPLFRTYTVMREVYNLPNLRVHREIQDVLFPGHS